MLQEGGVKIWRPRQARAVSFEVNLGLIEG
jgi:hypothetical protein